MIRFLTGVVCLVMASTAFGAGNKELDRLEDAGVVIEEILAIDDNIPRDLLDRAECVIVIPSMLKVAVGIGGSYGRGAMVCRTGVGYDGPWGAPAMYALDGGSVGLQLGGQASDLVLLVMNDRGVKALLNSKVKLGASATAAAGPKGRDVSASTDATLRAEILSYSRSRGLFAGVSLEGASLRPDNDASEQVYGRRITARAIVTGTDIPVPAAGRRLVDALAKNAPRNTSQKATN
ncbi:MAG TPA: lipid-binding SYLF domain-containing protein [Vicinamibacterales bacterium]|jgi:lipid-binding SYLF domain-containing protein|nr:lipid-binding SYLF domain-containing protein [Vicinamibacterales bacterium]